MHVYVIDIDKDREAATGPQHKDIDLPDPIISEMCMKRVPQTGQIITIDKVSYIVYRVQYPTDNSPYYVLHVKRRLE
jgi:hypothetical protein